MNRRGGIGVLIALLSVVLIAGCGAMAHGTIDHVRSVVKRTESVTSGIGDSTSSKYLVFTKSETFQNTDSMWHGKFNSSDIYGSLETGTEYILKVYGFRVPFLSMYRNIISVEKI